MATIEDCVRLRPDFKIEEGPLSLRATWTHEGLPYELIASGEARAALIDACHRSILDNERQGSLGDLREDRDAAVSALVSAVITLEAASLVMGNDIAATYTGPVKVREYAKHVSDRAAAAREVLQRIVDRSKRAKVKSNSEQST